MYKNYNKESDEGSGRWNQKQFNSNGMNHLKPRLSMGSNGEKNKSNDIGSILKVTKVIRQKYFYILKMETIP